MNSTEKRATWSLSLIYAFRMFGLFMIFPVFVIYAQDIPGATPQTIGLALGVYGLTQALLQIPFGMASDKFGRKPIITIGLLLFALGSVLAALSDDMLGLIIGRAVQGSGAIAAAIMALASDVTREENRTKIMASIGISIGISFSVSLVMGPVFINWFSLSGLFWITAILSSLGIIILYLWVPTPSTAPINEQPLKQQLSAVLKNKQLLKLDVSIFVLHMILTSLFLVLPTLMVDAGLLKENHWQVYLPVLLLSFVIMIPFIIFAEKKKQITKVFLFAIALLAISLLSLYLYRRPLAGIVVSLLLFFVAFNVLEASLPSLVSKISPANLKGGAMGVYTTSQFMGVFVGGLVSGWVISLYGVGVLLLVLMAESMVWMFVIKNCCKQPFDWADAKK